MALSAATIPTQVSNTMLPLLKESLVYGNLFNQDYIGEVSKGNALKIASVGSVTIEDYTRYDDLEGQNASDASVTLSIDKAKAFSIVLDDLDEVQALPNIMSAYLVEATHGLKKELEGDLAAALSSAATLVTGFGTSDTPIEVNSSNICTQLRSMALAMDNALVPRNGRSIVLPPWAVEKLAIASIVNATDNTAVMANGSVGRYAGFDIFMSPLVPNTTNAKYEILAANPMAATYAVQIEKTEVLRHPTQFADIIRGLCVYGAKATRPGTIVKGIWNLAAES